MFLNGILYSFHPSNNVFFYSIYKSTEVFVSGRDDWFKTYFNLNFVKVGYKGQGKTQSDAFVFVCVYLS